jgi:hypothetical protein
VRSALARGGHVAAASKMRFAVQRTDVSYLYELGATIRPLGSLGFENLAHPWTAWGPLKAARDAVAQFLWNSIYSSGLRALHKSGDALIAELNKLLERIEAMEWQQEDNFNQIDIVNVNKAFSAFEPVMLAELQQASTFVVFHKGGFDNRFLVDDGEQLFPRSLALKVPTAAPDVITGARCMAFELWTAMAFHFHRANEAVLRAYFDQTAGADALTAKKKTMGSMVSHLEQKQIGDLNILAALKNLTVFHRNAIAHPDHNIETVDEALSLYAAVRAAMGYMLNELPNPVVNPQQIDFSNDVATN